MENLIRLPHFTIGPNEVLFLNQYPYLKSNRTLNIEDHLDRKMLIDEGILIQKRKIEKGSPCGKKILVLEPHPDDFALSCSGSVLSKLKEGVDIEIMTLFTQFSLSTFPWRSLITISDSEYEKLRLTESRIAISNYLDITSTSSYLPSALKRDHSTAFGELNLYDEKLIERCYPKIIEKAISGKYSAIFAPLAIQHHLDHTITFKIAKMIKQECKDITLILYEDFPYARNKVAYAHRLNEVSSQMQVYPRYIYVDSSLEIMADIASIYRSQFDDINRSQMLALFREDTRSCTKEMKTSGFVVDGSHHQRVFEVGSVKK
ncbi:PIG-L family deacetylase [Candidatus Woesearchaeota archaeon]|nr:PIG-L family deacetylase [Candidatus Woesearchaeota archaeon]